MSNDRELLELAAKASGVTPYLGIINDKGVAAHLVETHTECYKKYWNPLTDDGDALRLAVKMKMRFSTVCNLGDQAVASVTDIYSNGAVEDHNGDPYAATRRAIVRAAAEIGRAI